jgi:hypothetical protein
MAMDLIRVRMACGCVQPVEEGAVPYCDAHRETRIQSVQAPPPRIRAVGCEATGPHVTQETR